MPIQALTSAEISLPARPDAGLVRERIAILAKHVDLVGLTDNHAGQPRMSPLAAVALAREQGVATVVHVSCRDRNRLALRSQVIGAATLGCDGVLCLYGDPVPGVPRVKDYTTTRLLAEARSWVEPYELALGCVVDPFAVDVEAELALLGRKIAAGADFAQTQMVLEPGRLAGFLDRMADSGKLGDCAIYASVPVIRTRRLADLLNQTLPFELPRRAYDRIVAGGGIEMAIETAIALAELPQVDALHVMAWGSEEAAGQVAAAFREARGAPAERRPHRTGGPRGTDGPATAGQG
jgi:methylenetetrahydrofolate reductase (NADPH)